MLLPAALALLLLCLVGYAVSAEYLLRVRTTDRRQLHPNGLVRAGRSVRALGLRTVLGLAAWPHVVELALGLHRTATGCTPRYPFEMSGPVTLWRYGAGEGAPVLLVHSLVTGTSVLDLRPGNSLVEALVTAGHDVWLLDWGRPDARHSGSGLDGYGWLLQEAEAFVRTASGQDVHVVGYCAGGLLAAAWHAAHGHVGVASLSLVATPIDTAAAGGMMSLLRGRAALPGLVLDGNGLVPAAVVREAFHVLRPQAVTTMRKLLARRGEPAFTAYAGALGRWAWDQSPVPGALAFDLVDLARGNALLAGSLTIGGRRADLRSLAGLPLLLVTTVRDHIVPPGSSLALRSVPGLSVSELQCTAGHVAMLTGGEAHRVLYPGLVRWLSEDRRPRPTAAPARA